MRFAVISDVHGNLPALRRVADHLRSQSVDGVINLGDCVTAPLWPQETFDALEELSTWTVRGNHDRWLGDPARAGASEAFVRQHLTSEARAALVALPASLQIEGEIMAVHGTPASDTEYLLEESVNDRLSRATTTMVNDRLRGTTGNLVLCGHSHLQSAAWAAGRRLVLNPGSVGCPRYADNAAPDRNEGGSPHARYAVVTRRGGEWAAELFVLEYDWSVVAERAISVGRPDWAAGFLRDA